MDNDGITRKATLEVSYIKDEIRYILKKIKAEGQGSSNVIVKISDINKILELTDKL